MPRRNLRTHGHQAKRCEEDVVAVSDAEDPLVSIIGQLGAMVAKRQVADRTVRTYLRAAS